VVFVVMLGLDLGTGSVKAAIVDSDATILSRASKKYPIASPLAGWAESDPMDWLSAAEEAVSQAVQLGPERPTTIGFSGQMHGVVLTDAALTPLRPAILWADTRSAAEARQMNEDLGPAEMARLGSGAVAGFAATTLAWLHRHEPEVMAKARYILQPKDWLRATLGGKVGTEPSDASGTLLCDVASGQWSEKAMEWTGIRPESLPDIRPSHEHSGEVTVAGLTLASAYGGADTACAILGLGLEVGDGFVAVGSGAQIVALMDEPRLDPSLATHTFSTVGDKGSHWYRIGAVQNAGLALEPALAMLASSLEEAHDALSEGVLSTDPLFVPYLSGERTPFMDPGLRGSWHGISLGTTRKMIVRSVLEGVAQAVALGERAVSESGGLMPEILPLIGGGSTNPVFRQLLADCTNRPLASVEGGDAAVIGAALLGAGATSNPHRLEHSFVTHPRTAEAELLSSRREKMLHLIATLR
jgi:xylulokinase